MDSPPELAARYSHGLGGHLSEKLENSGGGGDIMPQMAKTITQTSHQMARRPLCAGKTNHHKLFLRMLPRIFD